jgi:hypothetical protein
MPEPRLSADDVARAVRDRFQHSRLALRETAERLGHGHLRLDSVATGLGYIAGCGCGWVSTTRPNQSDALGSVQQHLQVTVREWDRSGRPLPVSAVRADGRTA